MSNNEVDFTLLASQSMILSITGQDMDDSGEYVIVKLRVLNTKKWQSMIKTILLSSTEGEDFGCTVRQEYYLNEDSNPAFIWSLVIWGDLVSSFETLSPILNKRGAPPLPPKSLNVSSPNGQGSYTPSMKKTRDGSTIKEVLLPARHPGENSIQEDTVIKVGSPRSSNKARAFVRNIAG
jgi:hypothetical protein